MTKTTVELMDATAFTFKTAEKYVRRGEVETGRMMAESASKHLFGYIGGTVEENAAADRAHAAFGGYWRALHEANLV